jgi:hypothetical protein
VILDTAMITKFCPSCGAPFLGSICMRCFVKHPIATETSRIAEKAAWLSGISREPDPPSVPLEERVRRWAKGHGQAHRVSQILLFLIKQPGHLATVNAIGKAVYGHRMAGAGARVTRQKVRRQIRITAESLKKSGERTFSLYFSGERVCIQDCTMRWPDCTRVF